MNPNEIVVNLDEGLYANNLLKPDINQFVWDYQGNFNVLNFMASRGNGLRKAVSKFGQVQDAILDLPVVQALILSVTVISATQLQINFTSPTEGFIPTGNVTNNFALNTRARVIYVDTNSNYIIIQSTNDSQVLVASQWAANTWITQEYNTQPRLSTGTPSTYYMPSFTYNNCTKMRRTVTINLEDDEATWVTAQDGKKYWYFAQEELNLEELMREDELNSLKGQFGLWSPDQSPSNGGVVWAIKDPLRGGVWAPYFSPPSLSDFTSWLDEIANRNNRNMTYLTVACGRGAIETFQNWTSNYVQYAGVFNTFGGEAVEGINVMRWAYGQIVVQLIALPSLNSEDSFRNPSAIMPGSVEYNTMIELELDQMKSVASSTNQTPLQRIYQGRKEMIVKMMPGVVDEDLMEKATGMLAVTDADNFTIQYLTRTGINYMARNGGLFQPGA